MAGVAVVTDSTASLDPVVAARARVTVVPLQVVIDEVSRPESADGVTPAVVASALRRGCSVTTSRPAPEAFAAVYADLAAVGHREIVSVHLSRLMSGTYAAAVTAAETAAVPVTVVDSRTLAMATGFAVLSGAAAAAGGADGAEVAAVVQRRAEAAQMYFSVETLDHLRRGGRIGPAVALLGSALSVKPLLTVTGGQIRSCERVRTSSRALARLEELAFVALTRAGTLAEHVDLAVHHLDRAAAANALAERLDRRVPGRSAVSITEVSAVLAAHVGPGTLGVVVSPR
jgi:DegV family protein with EDD domain